MRRSRPVGYSRAGKNLSVLEAMGEYTVLYSDGGGGGREE